MIVIEPIRGTFPKSIQTNSEVTATSAKEVNLTNSRIPDKTSETNIAMFSKIKIFGTFLPSSRVTIKPSSGRNKIKREYFTSKDSLIKSIS